jgi:outer membrane beta-barrel protein
MKLHHLIYTLGVVLVPFALHSVAIAEVIEFPEEELARESVLPKFDRPDVVKNRAVITAKKFEVAPYIGFNLTEPIYNQMRYGARLGYHWSEESTINLNFAKHASGLNTQYTDGLSIPKYKLDFSRIPAVNYSYYLNYEYKLYYGKISFTKEGTMNLSTYPIFGVGMTSYETKSYPGVAGGIGQKFYFGKSFGLRFDFRVQYSQGPSPFLVGRMKTSDPIPQKGEFEDKWSYSTILDVGVTFVF